MSFADPLWLLALLLVPLALLARWAARERARRYAVRFTAVGSLRAAVAQASRSRWRGWLPAAALLAATVLLVAGLARPHVRHRVPIRDASLMLVLDHSGSMMSTDVAPTRLGAAIRAANDFIDQVPGSIRIGAIGFSSEADAVQRPVRDHAAARALVDAQQAGGGTSTGPALTLALQLLDASKAKHAPAAVVLLSDGAANAGVSPIAVAQQAKREHVPIYTVALGTPGGTINGGRAVLAPDPGAAGPGADERDRRCLRGTQLRRPDRGPAELDLQEPRPAAQHGRAQRRHHRLRAAGCRRVAGAHARRGSQH